MKMGGVFNPFSEASIQFVIDSDEVRRTLFALMGDDDAATDPVVHDPKADAVALA